MIALQGYNITETVYSSVRTIVYRGPNNDGQTITYAVAVKANLARTSLIILKLAKLTINNIKYSSVFNQPWIEYQLQSYNTNRTKEVVVS